MIVLTNKQKEEFLEFKKSIQAELNANCCDFIPIEIKGDLWILPDEVLLDPNFSKLKELISDKNYEKREVLETEFKTIEDAKDK
jgi:hypothetical protein